MPKTFVLTIISKYHRVKVEWNYKTLEAVLRQLRQERHHIDTEKLLAEAEQIKAATNIFAKENATQSGLSHSLGDRSFKEYSFCDSQAEVGRVSRPNFMSRVFEIQFT